MPQLITKLNSLDQPFITVSDVEDVFQSDRKSACGRMSKRIEVPPGPVAAPRDAVPPSRGGADPRVRGILAPSA